jgi:hypothetical protein
MRRVPNSPDRRMTWVFFGLQDRPKAGFRDLTLNFGGRERCSSRRMGLVPREWLMNELIKIAVCTIIVIALSPLLGFWIVALVGAGLILLPAGVIFSTIFPKAWKHVEDNLFSNKSSLSPS